MMGAHDDWESREFRKYADQKRALLRREERRRRRKASLWLRWKTFRTRMAFRIAPWLVESLDFKDWL